MAELHICKLEKDQDIMGGLHDYMMDKKWKSGYIVNAVGSVYDVTFGNPLSFDLKSLGQKTFAGPFEVVSFVGEVTKKSEMPQGLPKAILDAATSDYFIHVHLSCSHGEDALVNGGSLRTGKVLRALTVFMFECG